MTSGFRPGAVAVIARPWNIDADIGRPVTLIRAGAVGDTYVQRNGRLSRVGGETCCGNLWVWLCDANDGEFPCFVCQCCLRLLGDSSDASEDVGAGDLEPALLEGRGIEMMKCDDCGHCGDEGGSTTESYCGSCGATVPYPREDRCTECGATNCMLIACPGCGGRYWDHDEPAGLIIDN